MVTSAALFAQSFVRQQKKTLPKTVISNFGDKCKCSDRDFYSPHSITGGVRHCTKTSDVQCRPTEERRESARSGDMQISLTNYSQNTELTKNGDKN